jgi:hypothetical protein
MEDYLQYQDYDFVLPSSKYQCQQMYQANNVDCQESTEIPSADTLSTSGSYTSSKQSPEYQYPTETDEKTTKGSKIPPIIRKGIHKYYEPIQDSDAVFYYEDNPNEYKKARKRIQNRESATRVRNRKKTYVEELEQEMEIIRRENQELKVRNSSMAAENHLLKQQITYLENLAETKNENQNIQQHTYNQNENYFLNIDDVKEEDSPLSPRLDFGFSRFTPKTNFGKHATFLGVLTMIICASALLSNPAGGVTGRAIVSTLQGSNNTAFDHGAKEAAFNILKPLQSWNWQMSMHFLIKKFEDPDFLMTAAQYLFGIGYVVYIIYVLLLMKWGNLMKKAKRV